MESFLTFIGRFHPLLVHLPIGFILIALLLEFNRSKFRESEKILKFILFWVLISGGFSILSGYFQYQQEGYLWESVQGHFYSGIVTLVFSIGFYIFLQKQTILNRLPRSFFSLGLLFSLIVTGHLGGNITHGKEHLTEPLEELSSTLFGNEEESKTVQLDEKNYSEQVIYTDLVAPILSKKCVSCHNSKNTKGGLQLHTFQALLQGGKNGPIINYENTKESELFLRIHLPKEEKKHMPPKSKKQLTKAEIDFISYWIELGAPQDQTLEQLGTARALIKPFFSKEENRFYPELKLDAPNPETIKTLIAENLLIAPVNRESNLIKISALNIPEFENKDMKLLEGIRSNIVSIDLSYTAVNDSVFDLLAGFPNLVQIKLNHTQITGEGIQVLESSKHLKQLYLVETELNAEFLQLLSNFPSLEQVFVFHSKRNLSQEIELSPKLNSIIEFGAYGLPKLPSDEVIY
jgi:uncharacterized membrane protein